MTDLEIKTTSTKSLSKKISNKKNKTQSSSIYVVGHRLFSKRISFLFPRLYSINENLEKAMMPIPYQVYVCGMVFLSAIAGVVGLAVGIGFSLALQMELGIKVLLPIIMALAFSQATFLMMFKYPSMNVGMRKSRIEVELPFFTSYMSTLASSNLTLEEIFEKLANDDPKQELVKDAKTLLRNIQFLGMDIITALTEMARRSPSEAYSELLEGLISNIQSGGQLKEFFLANAKAQMGEKKASLRKKAASLGMITELYTILLIVFPLMGIIMLSIMAIMSEGLGGMDLTALISLLTYLLVPIFGMVLLFMMDTMVPKR